MNTWLTVENIFNPSLANCENRVLPPDKGIVNDNNIYNI